MMKKLSRLLIALSLVFTVSVSAFACDDGSNAQLPEFVAPSAYTDGIHNYSYTVSNTDFVVDGQTSYKLLLPDVQSSQLKTAKQEFELLFEDATGIKISSTSDHFYDSESSQKYISFGETKLFNDYYVDTQAPGFDPATDTTNKITDKDYDKAGLDIDGLRIITKGDHVFLLGGTDYGVVNAVYDFMTIYFNFEYYYRNCIYIDNCIGKDLKLYNFDVKDVPDIDRRAFNVAWYGTKNPRNYDLAGGLQPEDIANAASRARLTGSHYADMIPCLDKEGWKKSSNGYLHNVQEYYPVMDSPYINKSKPELGRTTLYVNYEKYFYEEYDLDTGLGVQDYEKYVPTSMYEGVADQYKIDAVEGDNDGNGIPDDWHRTTTKDAGSWWKGVSVCYTAEGDNAAKTALAKRVAEVVIQAMQNYPYKENPLTNFIMFSMEDAGGPCSCEGCKPYYELTGSHCAAINRLLNEAMRDYIRPWMDMKDENGNYVNEKYRRPELVLGYFVYSALTGVPELKDNASAEEKRIFQEEIACDENVGVYIAGAKFSRYDNIYNRANEDAYHILTTWRTLTPNIWIWGYSVSSTSAAFFDDAIAGYNSDYYQLLASMGVKYMFNESQDIGDEALGWQNLNSYVQAEWMWDSTLDADKLVTDYCDNMFLEAGDTMKSIWTQMRVHRQYILDKFDMRYRGISGTAIANTKYWPMGLVVNWIEQFDKAIEEISKYKAIDYNYYLLIKDRIEIEKAQSLFVALYLYKNALPYDQFVKYKTELYEVCLRYPNLQWQGSYSSSVKTVVETL